MESAASEEATSTHHSTCSLCWLGSSFRYLKLLFTRLHLAGFDGPFGRLLDTGVHRCTDRTCSHRQTSLGRHRTADVSSVSRDRFYAMIVAVLLMLLAMLALTEWWWSWSWSSEGFGGRTFCSRMDPSFAWETWWKCCLSAVVIVCVLSLLLSVLLLLSLSL